jgi:hypothetical protein
MEKMFNTNLSDVRIHTEGRQAESLGALAFTTGNDIYFASGRYNPYTQQGQRLLGHELTHVIQQKEGRVKNPYGNGITAVHNPGLEAEAERMGIKIADNCQSASLQPDLFPSKNSLYIIQLAEEQTKTKEFYCSIVFKIKEGNLAIIQEAIKVLNKREIEELKICYATVYHNESKVLWLLPLLMTHHDCSDSKIMEYAQKYANSDTPEKTLNEIIASLESTLSDRFWRDFDVYNYIKDLYTPPPSRQEVIEALNTVMKWATEKVKEILKYRGKIIPAELAKRLTTLTKVRYFLYNNSLF